MAARPRPAHLMPKLVAREAEHHQAPGSEALLQLVHLGVVPDRSPSERRHILNKQHLAAQGTQVQGLPAGQWPRREGVHRLGSRCHLSRTHGVSDRALQVQLQARETMVLGGASF